MSILVERQEDEHASLSVTYVTAKYPAPATMSTAINPVFVFQRNALRLEYVFLAELPVSSMNPDMPVEEYPAWPYYTINLAP